MAGESKTEKASPKKRKDERKKGNVFQSKDIVSVVSILLVFLMLKFLFPYIYNEISKTFIRFLNYIPVRSALSMDFLKVVIRDTMVSFLIIVLPIALCSMAVGVITTGAQTQFLMAYENIKPKFERIDPLKGFQRMFSLRSFVEVIKGMIKISVIAYMLYTFVQSKIVGFSRTLEMDLTQAVLMLFDAVMSLVINVSLIFIFLAGLDFLYQWWEYERNIKMSKHDVKEEYKQMEGDPKVKGAIKDKQRKMAMSRMMQAVPTADVIIKNPTHFAVALRYDIDKDTAPIVVAMGQDQMALRMIRIAEENDIFVIENKPLARAIYASAELNREIPFEYFSAVAEVLALVYTLKNKTIL